MSQQDYRLHELLGTGMASDVYRADHVASGTVVALKRIQTDDARMIRAVEQEIRAMAKVSHANLLTIYDHGRLLDGDGLWLALEYASGGSLEDWEPSNWDDVWVVLDDVLFGLAHAHARGLVHRDIKPANLLRALPADVSPGVKVGDFGLTTLRGVDPAVRRGGTPRYMAPEQWTAAPVTPSSDLYGLACILWEWTTGQTPFVGTLEGLRAQHKDRPPPVYIPRFDVPAPLGPLLQDLLAKEPASRPASAGDVRRRVLGTSPRRAVRQMLLTTPTLPPVPPGLGLTLQPLRDHAVVGREDARRALVATLERVLEEQRPHVQLLSGPPGVGKTRMARWIAETTAEAGVARLLADPTVAEAQEAAEHGPVIVLFDEVTAEIDTRLRALQHTSGALLAVACTSPSWNWEVLERQEGVHRLELGPMNAKAYRWFLQGQLGLTPTAARRLEGPGEGVPGVATAWTRDLAARGKLVATAEGFAIRGDLPPPPSLHDGEKVLARVLCRQAEPEARRAMQVAAMLGDTVSDEAWEGALARLELATPDLVDELTAVGVLVRRDDHWQWSSRAARQTVLGDDARPGDWIAVAESLEALPADAARGIRAGLARLAAGDVPTARRRLLVHYPMQIDLFDLVREAVEALRPHMEHATTTQRVFHTRLDLITQLNLGEPEDAEVLALQLAQELGTVHQHGPLRAACDPEVRQRALETAASVFAHLRQYERVDALLEGLPETADALRVRALVAMRLQQHSVAYDSARRGYEAAKAGTSCRAALANILGSLTGAAGDNAEAERWFRQSVLDSDEATAFTQWINVAIAVFAQGRYRDAVRPARRALVLAERAGKLVPQAYVTYAIAAALAGRTQDVRRFGPTALAMVRRNPGTVFPSLADPARDAHVDDPVIQRFLDALMPLTRERSSQPR